MTDYCFPSTVEEALRILQRFSGQALVIAGGTDVLPDLRKDKRKPTCLVDITRIPNLGHIEVGREVITVGAAVPFAAIKDHTYLNLRVHVLPDAARSVGALGIQAAATWVGNIVQAMPAADGAIAALALNAQALVADGSGKVWQPVGSLFLGPGRSAVDPTHQLITHIRFAVPQGSWGTAWRRIGRRQSLVLPILNCAATVLLEGAYIQQATIALGPVAPRPFRARQAEAFLAGREPGLQVLEEAGWIACGESNPRSSTMRASREYRLAIIPSLVRDALTVAAKRAQLSIHRSTVLASIAQEEHTWPYKATM
jgi:carbon-monoxide dehydrogenase medium subunit